MIEDHAALRLKAIEQKLDPTLAELREMFVERDVTTSIATLWRFSPGMGLRTKKGRPRERAGLPDVLKRCELWFQDQRDLDPDRLVSID